jgi:adenylate cyclase
MRQEQNVGLPFKQVWQSLWRKPSTSELPDRVKMVVTMEDRASERLIGLVQLGIGCTLWALYLLAPRPTDAAISIFSPVPIALSIYLSFSLFRYWLILQSRTPDWFVGLSISVDVGLLLALIWAFHIEYQQPAGFSLKAPTFVYLFVFVVLRALRFDARYVLAAGATAAAGWIVLTLAAAMSDGPGAITRSFTDYATSSRILFGAEFDKVFALLLTTGLLALNARRAQRTLIAAVREEAAAKEIGRFLSRGVADQIAGSDTLIVAGEAVERDAAILMIDIRGFTAFAMNVPPKQVVEMLTSFHSRIIPIVRAHGGVIDKFLGDGVMATFGAATPSPVAAAEALRALDEILADTVAWQASLAKRGIGANLNVNAAVASGPVVFATLGDGDRLEFTVIGDAVNLAAKLEKHNKIEKSRALFPASTFAAAVAQGYRPATNPQTRAGARVAGVTGTMDLCARAV